MKTKWLKACSIAAALMGALILGSIKTSGQAGGPPSGLQSPAQSLVALGIPFQGAASCNNVDCHGHATVKPNGYSFSNEYTLWNAPGQDSDPHHNKTWQALTNPTGKKIAQGLAIPDARKSERCLNCHSLSVPQNLQGKNYKLTEGVTCNACHGPSTKYLDPHSKKDWFKQETAKANFEQMLKNWGLYNTLQIHARAERCTSCHLAIEPDLVAKGHPQPTFELNYFSETYPNRHWHDAEGYFKDKLWIGGQQVALYEALRQLASRANLKGKPLDDAHAVVVTHYTMMNLVLTSANPPAAAMQKVDAAYKSGSGQNAAAMAAVTVEGKLAGWSENYTPDKAATLKLLSAVAANKTLAALGKTAQDQQSYAIYALYSAYASAEKPANAEAVTGLIGSKLFPDMPYPTPQAYLQAVAAVQAQLPK